MENNLSFIFCYMYNENFIKEVLLECQCPLELLWLWLCLLLEL